MAEEKRMDYRIESPIELSGSSTREKIIEGERKESSLPNLLKQSLDMKSFLKNVFY